MVNNDVCWPLLTIIKRTMVNHFVLAIINLYLVGMRTCHPPGFSTAHFIGGTVGTNKRADPFFLAVSRLPEMVSGLIYIYTYTYIYIYTYAYIYTYTYIYIWLNMDDFFIRMVTVFGYKWFIPA